MEKKASVQWVRTRLTGHKSEHPGVLSPRSVPKLNPPLRRSPIVILEDASESFLTFDCIVQIRLAARLLN
jgi:hypothetical protein